MYSDRYHKSQKLQEMESQIMIPSPQTFPSEVMVSTSMSGDLRSINESPKAKSKNHSNASPHESPKRSMITVNVNTCERNNPFLTLYSSPTSKALNTPSHTSSPFKMGARFYFTTKNSMSAVYGAALSFVDGVGTVVQNTLLAICTLNLCHGDEYHYSSTSSMRRIGSNLTLDDELRYDLNEMRRITSWNTYGSLSINTNTASLLVDDDGNQISADTLKAHQSKKDGVNKLSNNEVMVKSNGAGINENDNLRKEEDENEKLQKFTKPEKNVHGS